MALRLNSVWENKAIMYLDHARRGGCRVADAIGRSLVQANARRIQPLVVLACTYRIEIAPSDAPALWNLACQRCLVRRQGFLLRGFTLARLFWRWLHCLRRTRTRPPSRANCGRGQKGVKLPTRRATPVVFGPISRRGMSLHGSRKGSDLETQAWGQALGSAPGEVRCLRWGFRYFGGCNLHPNKDESTSAFSAWNVFWSYLGWMKF
jgi:hypothetical protein